MQTVPLGELADSVMGQAPPGKACNKEGYGTPFVKAGEFDDRFPVVREWTTQPLKYAKSGDVLICVVGATAGKINQGIDCAIGRSVAAIRPKANRLDTGFLYHLLKQKTLEMRQKSQGLAQGVITREMIASVEVPDYELEEQKRIAAILDQADDIRRKRQQAIDRLNQLGQAIFYEMFGDSAINSRGWQIGRIDDLTASTQYGTSSKAGESGEYPILRMGNLLYSGELDFTGMKFIDFPVSDVEKYTVRSGDILFNRTNSPDLVGKTAIYYGKEPMGFAGYLVRLRVNDRAVPEFINAYLNSTYGKAILRGMCKAIIGMANINAKELRGIPIPLPPIELQHEFKLKITAMRDKLDAPKDQLKQFESLFTSLQHRAFTGQL